MRDGVITGEGPTTKGRVHFSRALDADDTAWCARILTVAAVNDQPVSRAEAEVLFEINEAATERTDGGRFDDLLAKAVAHYAASASGLKVPPRSVALSAETDIESWAPAYASKVNSEMLEWIAGQMRGKRHNNRRLMAMVATFLGATALPLAGQLPNVFDIGMQGTTTPSLNNASSVTQVGVFGNSATTGQVATGNNTSSISQSTLFGLPPNNAAAVGQLGLGINSSTITQH